MDAKAGFGSDLSFNLIRKPDLPARIHALRIPGLGRVMFTKDKGTGFPYRMQTRLHGVHRDGDGALKGVHDLGSGNITQNFVNALAQDTVGTTNNKAAPVLAQSMYMYTGTSNTAVTAYDYKLNTSTDPASAAATAATLTVGYSVNNATLQYVNTVAYSGSKTIQEWGLFTANLQGSTANTSTVTYAATTISGTSWAGTALTSNSVAGYIAIITGTPVGAVILSNTAGASGVLTISSADYYNLSAGGGVAGTPSTNTAVNVFPNMVDHQTFGGIAVVNGDSIQFTWTASLVSGS